MKKCILLIAVVFATSHVFGQTNDQKGPGISTFPDAQWIGSNTNTATAYRNGNVAIGTSSTTDGFISYKLSVDGKVRATSVKVYNDWADFVFEKDYTLPSLPEVESFILQNGHLKDIPSAEQVAKEGIDLGQMNKRLLQKVEELTLYVIALNKEIEALKKQ